jgi:hypothetical protein
MTDVDRQVARAGEVLDRTRAERAAQRGRRRAATSLARRVGYAAAADLAILVAAMTIGWFVPIGMGGALIVAALMAVVTATLLFASLTPKVRVEQLHAVPLKALPQMTEQWLETQRALLPAPAQTLVDGIGVRLEALAPQLQTLDEQQPAATEVRKLVGEQLPELLRRPACGLRSLPRCAACRWSSRDRRGNRADVRATGAGRSRLARDPRAFPRNQISRLIPRIVAGQKNTAVPVGTAVSLPEGIALRRR